MFTQNIPLTYLRYELYKCSKNAIMGGVTPSNDSFQPPKVLKLPTN